LGSAPIVATTRREPSSFLLVGTMVVGFGLLRRGSS
jgi:hypothetical protein